VCIEVVLLRRLPAVCIVGLPASQAKETAERVRSALEAWGFEFPRMRVVININPSAVVAGEAHRRPDGWLGLDLPIALAILSAAGLAEVDLTRAYVGELTLDGRIRPVRGLYGIVQREHEQPPELTDIVIPHTDGELEFELRPAAASLPTTTKVFTAATLREAIAPERVVTPTPWPLVFGEHQYDFAEMRTRDAEGEIVWGPDRTNVARTIVHALARSSSGLVIANVHPGCGAFSVVNRIPGIAPVTVAEAHSMARIRSAAAMPTLVVSPTPAISRPFRAPHHTVSLAGLTGAPNGVGELLLARHGVLVLDDVEQFSRVSLEAVAAAPPDVFVVLVSSLSRDELAAVLPPKLMVRCLATVDVAQLEGNMLRGHWPHTSQMREMLVHASGGL
jgi:magnesium chelatase family protein